MTRMELAVVRMFGSAVRKILQTGNWKYNVIIFF